MTSIWFPIIALVLFLLSVRNLRLARRDNRRYADWLARLEAEQERQHQEAMTLLARRGVWTQKRAQA